MIRLFTAIAVDAELAKMLGQMAAGIPGARWVAPRNLHVTLRFIGDIEDGLAVELHGALAALDLPGFDLTLDGFGTFGSRRPHTLWAGVVPEPAMDRLQAKIDTVLWHLGHKPEPRKFTPHVTLARLGGEAHLSRIQAFIAGNSPFRAGPIPVTHFTLFRSHLSRNGAEYDAVAEYGLG